MGSPSSIEWAFPGPAPYTYMHINPRDLGLDVTDMTDAYELGVQFMIHLNLWMQGIEAGKKIDVSRDIEFKDAEPGPTLAERNLKAQPMTPAEERKAIHEAAVAVATGTPEGAEALVVKALGATVVESDAPWNNKDMAPTASKPWEKKQAKTNSTIDI